MNNKDVTRPYLLPRSSQNSHVCVWLHDRTQSLSIHSTSATPRPNLPVFLIVRVLRVTTITVVESALPISQRLFYCVGLSPGYWGFRYRLDPESGAVSSLARGEVLRDAAVDPFIRCPIESHVDIRALPR